MKIKKFIWRLALLFLLVAALWVALNWTHIRSFPRIISAFYAKEFCSCYFVVGRDEEFCHNYARQWVPISSFALDQQAKTVTVSGLGHSTTVIYTSEQFGCAYRDP